MTTTQLITFTNSIYDGPDSGPGADHWDGYVYSTSQPFIDGLFQGYFQNWGIFDEQSVNGAYTDQQYSGYNTNFGGFVQNNTNGAFVNNVYTGFNTNFGATDLTLLQSPKGVLDVDIDSVVDYPKDQTIYYKLKGWNPITLSYESWVISENITGRPPLDGGLFDPDPGRQPPNIERNIFTTPPSGNSLVDIVITARWIE